MFLNRINEMTKKGVYPSLSILLEEDDNASAIDQAFDLNDEEEDKSEEPAGDLPSGDDSDSEDSEAKDDEVKDDQGITPEEAESIEVASKVADIKKDLDIIKNQPSTERFVDEFLPASSIVDNKIYSLENFVILKEESEDLENSLKNVEKILDDEDNKETILKLKKKASQVQSGDKNFAMKIPDLVRETIKNIENFDSKYDKASIAAADMFSRIEGQSEPQSIRKNIEDYIYQLAEELDKREIPHALNVKSSVDTQNYRNAQGGFNRG